MPDPFLTWFGIKSSAIAAGISGGVARAMLVRGGWYVSFISVVIGLMTSIVFSSTAMKILKTQGVVEFEEHAVWFFVSLTAISICEGIMRIVGGWSKKQTLKNEV